jgi:hypothetical protein
MRAHRLNVANLSVETFATGNIAQSAGTTTLQPLTGQGDTSPDGPCSGVICTYTCDPRTGGTY